MSVPADPSDIPILSVFALHLVQAIESLGFDPNPFLKRHELEMQQLKQPNARLPYKTYFALVDDVLDETGYPGLGLETGKPITLLEQGLLGYTFYSCESMGKVFEAYRNYAGIVGQVIHGQLVFDEELAYFTVKPGVLSAYPRLLQYECEMEFSMWFHMYHTLGGVKNWFSEVDFTSTNASHREQYEEHFSCPVRFGQANNRFVFRRCELEKSLDTSSAETAALLEAHCAALLKELSHQGGLTGDIQHLLARCAGRYPSIEKVCQHFHLSESTLRRRLAAEGTSYKQLLLNFRIDLACRYLSETNLSISEIAYLVGYTAPVNFFRAFQKSRRCSPNSYRISANAL